MQYEAFHAGFWTTGTFWVTVAVLLFLAAFGAKILQGIANGLDKRAAGISGALAEAERLRREAETMLQEAERRQKAALETAREIAAGAEARAHRLAADLAREAELAQARREAVVNARIAAARVSAVKEVRAAATDLAVATVARLLAETFGPEADAAAIDGAIAELPARLRAA